jgi:nucleotide-binding universal stress UspA family protein
MERILVALDTSDNSTFVIARAVDLATALGARIRLLTAVQLPPIVAPPMLGPVYFDPSVVIGLGEAMLRERERDIPPALRDGLAVELGIASDVICSVARSYDADLVVIGAHRHGAVARLLGTTAASIVNHIDRPVIVVRPSPSELQAIGIDVAGGMRAGDFLRRDHERLEKTYEGLLAAYQSGDWEEVRAQWDIFEPALRAHMNTEEQDVFPALRQADGETAEKLLAEHTELRRLLATLAVAVDLRAVPGADAEELVARLRAHGAREEALLYPWMDRTFDAGQLRRLSPAA